MQENTGSTPRLRRSHREGHGNPLQDSCLEKPMDRGAWQAQSMGSQRVGDNWAHSTHTHTTQNHILIFFMFKHQIWEDLLSFISLVLLWHLSPNIKSAGQALLNREHGCFSISATCCCHSILPYCFGFYIKPHSKKKKRFLISPSCSFFLILLLKWHIINTASRLIVKEDV